MPVADRAAIHIRIRRLFLEETIDTTTDFVDETLNPNEIDQAYDEACVEQHAIVMKNAEETGRLEDFDHPYLANFLMMEQYSLVRGTYEYGPVPSDLLRAVSLYVGGIRGTRRTPADDRLIRVWPDQYGPGQNEVFWIVTGRTIDGSPPDTVSRMLRVYVYGYTLVDGQPAVPVVSANTADFTYYRLTDPIAANSPPISACDVPDPYNDGPCHGAVARLQEKAQIIPRAQYHRTIAIGLANQIIPPATQG